MGYSQTTRPVRHNLPFLTLFNAMKRFKVSSRLFSIVGIAALIMLILASINWMSLSRLAELQDLGVQKSQAAGQVKHDANLGAQAYRVVADTFINQEFEESAKSGLKSTRN
jgi:hypothetical protein